MNALQGALRRGFLRWESGAVGAVSIAILWALAVTASLRWSLVYIVGFALTLGVATALARSLDRVLFICVAALPVVGFLFLLTERSGTTFGGDRQWGAGLFLYCALVIVVGYLWRRQDRPGDLELATRLGLGISTLLAIAIWWRIDFRADLLPLLITPEDNAAWYGLVSSITASESIAGFGTGLGPIVPLIQGIQLSAAASGIPYLNAPFTAYALVFMLLPVAVGVLLSGFLGRTRWWYPVALIVLMSWAFMLPFGLYTQGHLSATIAGVFLLLGLGLLIRTDTGLWRLIVGSLILVALPLAWFPIAPVSAFLLLILLVQHWKRGTSNERRVAGAIGVLFGVAVVVRIAGVLSTPGDGLGAVVGQIRSLFSAVGGTVTLSQGTLLFLVALILGLALLRNTETAQERRAMIVVGGVVASLVGVYVLAGILGADLSGYGVTKLTFVVGSALYVLVLAMVLGSARDRRSFAIAALGLLLAAFFLGNAGQMLNRAWPGQPAHPRWYGTVLGVVEQQRAEGDARPIACFSNDPLEAYTCTRWSAALSGRSFETADYRTSVLSPAAAAETARILVENGELRDADVIFIDPPNPDMPYSLVLDQAAGRKFGN